MAQPPSSACSSSFPLPSWSMKTCVPHSGKLSRFGLDLWTTSKGVLPPSVHVVVLFLSQAACWRVLVHRNLGQVCCNEHGLDMFQKCTIDAFGDSILLWGVVYHEASYSAI